MSVVYEYVPTKGIPSDHDRFAFGRILHEEEHDTFDPSYYDEEQPWDNCGTTSVFSIFHSGPTL